MAKHTTYRGQTVDIEMMKFQNQTDRALGNANMNARGDKLGQGGTIIKTREELIAERERKMQLPDYIPEHTSQSIQVSNDTESFDDSMFELPEQETDQTEPKAQEESNSEPRRPRAKKNTD